MVAASVLMPAFRPGGMDVTFAGLRDQTFKDFEFITVDRRYEKRHEQIMRLAAEYKVNTIHVPEHRRNGKWAVVAAAWNTGFMLAQGEVILMLPDYAYAPTGWIEKHLQHHNGRHRLVMSPYLFLNLPPVIKKDGQQVTVPPPAQSSALAREVLELTEEVYDEISIFEQPFSESQLAGLVGWPGELQCPRLTIWPDDPDIYAHVHFRNESMPLSSILVMNGLDENMDRGKSHIDIEFGNRAKLMGCEFIADMENMLYILNPRTLFPSMPFGPAEDRWSYNDCWNYTKKRLATGEFQAPNTYSLRKRREAIKWWREAESVSIIDIPDEEYYG